MGAEPIDRVKLRTDPTGFVGGFNLYFYVSNNPVMFVDPLGLIWVTTGHDYHTTKNVLNLVARHFAFAEEGRAITHTDNVVGNTRDVIQEWQHDKDNPCRDKEHRIGETRRIKQTFVKKPNPLPDGLWDETTDYYWSPQVPTRTYKKDY